MRLSIVIPAYNVEQWLERCVDSCEDQDIPRSDYEIIIVDDGSKDNTLAVAHRLAEKYGNITVLTQENQGQSAARNKGIEVAKGNYIWFVDSDDYVVENSVYSVLVKAEENGLDALYMCSYLTDAETPDILNQDVYCVKIQPIDKIIAGREAIINGYNPGSVCATFFKRKLILESGVSFKKGMYHEDSDFNFCLMPHMKRVMFAKTFLYCYVVRPNSSTTSKAIDNVIKWHVDDGKIYLSWMELAQRIENDDKLKNVITKRARSVLIGTVFAVWRKRNEYKKRGIGVAVIKAFEEMGIYPIKHCNNLKQWLFVKLILNHPSFFK